MDAKTPDDLAEFRKTALATLRGLKPAIDGLGYELKRQAKTSHDHEDFLIHEFRELVRALDGLTAQLARM